jgi:hypothetical protein
LLSRALTAALVLQQPYTNILFIADNGNHRIVSFDMAKNQLTRVSGQSTLS